RLRLLIAALLTGLVANGAPLATSAVAGTALATGATRQPAPPAQAHALQSSADLTGALVPALGAKPTPPAGGHHAPMPWVTGAEPGAMAPAKVSHLQPRTPVRPLQPRPAVKIAPGRTAATGPKREVFGFAKANSLGDTAVGYTTWNFSLLSTVAYFG